MNDLVLELECSEPLYLQLYAALRDRILDGEIRPGTRLPATRSLAQRLGVSRSVVVASYKLLTERGYAYAHVGSGTFAKSRHEEGTASAALEPHGDEETRQAEPRVSRAVRRLLELDIDPEIVDSPARRHAPIDFGLPDLPEPRTSSPNLQDAPEIPRFDVQGPGPQPLGLPALRGALARLLRRARDLHCAPDQVVIVPDLQFAYDILARTLVDSGTPVIIEDPNHPHVRTTLESVGAELLLCPIGDAGLDANVALQGESSSPLVCVAPTDQFPTGATIDLAGRRRLLARSHSAGAMIIEDTLDLALEPAGPMPPWLGSLDREGRVIHLGTMAHVPTPDLRLSFIVLPTALIEPVQHLMRLARHATPTDAQRALAQLIVNGLYERLARRDQQRQARLRATLTDEARKLFGDEEMRLAGGIAAPRITLRFPDLTVDDEARLARHARDQHVAVTRLSSFYVAAPPRAGLVLGYGELSEPGIREGIRRLHRAWRDLRRVGTVIGR